VLKSGTLEHLLTTNHNGLCQRQQRGRPRNVRPKLGHWDTFAPSVTSERVRGMAADVIKGGRPQKLKNSDTRTRSRHRPQLTNTAKRKKGAVGRRQSEPKEGKTYRRFRYEQNDLLRGTSVDGIPLEPLHEVDQCSVTAEDVVQEAPDSERRVT
jgi:hypothetical protein